MSVVENSGSECMEKYKVVRMNNEKENEVILSEDLEDQILKIIQIYGLFNPTIERKIIPNAGGNYLGILYEVNIKGKTVTGNQEINLFVKNIIPDDKMTTLSIQEAYKREMFVYNELSKVYEEIQAEFHIPENERYVFVKCHGVVSKKGAETLFLENMCKKGYTTIDRMACMSLRFAELSVVELAKFHALSYALRKFRPNYFEKVVRPIKAPFNFNADMESFIRNISKNTLTIYESTPTQENIENFVKKLIKKIDSYFVATDRPVLCHGDYRANNIMMKEEGGVIKKVMPVDYQLMHVGNPFNDFIYLVFGSSDQNFRRRHLTALKSLYRNTMANFLKYFDIDLETWYPLKIFKQDYKDRLDYGLVVGINFLPIILAPDGDIPDFGETKISDIKIEISDVFKDRIQGIVDDFLQWGYI